MEPKKQLVTYEFAKLNRSWNHGQPHLDGWIFDIGAGNGTGNKYKIDWQWH